MLKRRAYYYVLILIGKIKSGIKGIRMSMKVVLVKVGSANKTGAKYFWK
jgi:hypothetical protein